MSFGNTAKDGSGDNWWLVVNSLGQLIVSKGDTVSLEAEELANDSDKIFTVPADTEWEIQSIWVEYTSTVTAGNRIVSVVVMDTASDVIMTITAGVVQAQSLTRYYLFAPEVADLAAFRNTSYLTNTFPRLVLPAGYQVRVYDAATVDAAADDMVVQMLLKTRSV